MVVCDVSGKNPNVMFELGMRLAFDKPTIIVKDDKTSYSFDTSPIEHLTYPRDLRFQNIVEFKADLSAKIKGTAERVKSDKSYTTFLKHFGSFTTAELARKDLSTDEVILEELRDIRARLTHSSQRPSDSTRITGVQEAEMMRRIGMAIREFAQTNGKKTKRSMLLVRPTVIRYVEKAVNAPHHFRSAEAYYTAFDTAFDLMYSK